MRGFSIGFGRQDLTALASVGRNRASTLINGRAPPARFCASRASRARFERSLLAFQRRTPFRSFTVALVNGDCFRVEDPEALVLLDGVAVFIAAGGVPTLFG